MPISISSSELREKYQRFFESKEHRRLPSAPLVPEGDSSVLFTTAGMHPLVPYLQGQPHPLGRRLTNVQKCLRTTDIDEVGDALHATVFEMLGSWSLGDYFKEEAIGWSWEFLTDQKWLGLNPERLAVSVFKGKLPSSKPSASSSALTDQESAKIWKQVGIPDERLAYSGVEENWWPTGGSTRGPQGPDTEMFYWTGREPPPPKFSPEDSRWVEIWNDVFMEFNRTERSELQPLAQKNVDTGMGLERTVMVLNGHDSIYEIDTYRGLMKAIAAATRQEDIRHQRLVADHLRAASFIMGDENAVAPSNTERGYVLRRLIRRAVRSARQLGVRDTAGLFEAGLDIVVEQYGTVYPSLPQKKQLARDNLRREVGRFEKALAGGLKQLSHLISAQPEGGTLPGTDAFRLYESYGFPIELTQEVAREHQLPVDMAGFEKALREHQDKSRSAATGHFAGGLKDASRPTVKYHTATHLLHQALREVLGPHVRQKGSNITADRLRFDFSHSDKMTSRELKQTDKRVNEIIRSDLPVSRQEMTVGEARSKGALGLFGHKYGDKVSVYVIGSFSIEICGGPHVKSTGELGKFRIVKEQSSGAGTRRVKAILR